MSECPCYKNVILSGNGWIPPADKDAGMEAHSVIATLSSPLLTPARRPESLGASGADPEPGPARPRRSCVQAGSTHPPARPPVPVPSTMRTDGPNQTFVDGERRRGKGLHVRKTPTEGAVPAPWDNEPGAGPAPGGPAG